MSPAWIAILIGTVAILAGAGIAWFIAASVDAADEWWSE